VLADLLGSVSGSITALDVRNNSSLGDEGRALLQETVKGRAGFDLKL